MKKYFLSLLLLISCRTLAQTYVSGFISSNTTWDLAGSPYILIGNALLSHGSTLTVLPGVLVKFNDSTALQIDGELNAIGNAQNRITFTSNQAVPAAGDWGKIHFADTAVNAQFDVGGNYISGSIMKYCDVLYAGGIGFGAIHIEASSPYISNCRIFNSAANGIHSFESTYISDSSRIDNCLEYGLYFDYLGVNSNSCGIKMTKDSIMNNKTGGMYVTRDPACRTIIRDNYFFGNTSRGAIRVGWNISDLEMTGNYFVKDSVTHQNLGGSIVSLVFATGYADKHYIANNYFIDNYTSSLNQAYILYDAVQAGNDTIECNVFINNYTSGIYSGIIFLDHTSNSVAVVRNNLFEGNTSSNAGAFSIAKLDAGSSNSTAYFANNIIRANTADPQTPVCKFAPYLSTSVPMLFVYDNEITNNTALSAIYLDGPNVGSSNYDFISMQGNNFINPNSQYELYNNIPYGSPNVYPDSNYWGSSTSQHVDSVIFDFFDQANRSVVYYAPILTGPHEIDFGCLENISVEISKPNQANSFSIFPNPFSQQTTIRFENQISNGTFHLFSMWGQVVSAIENLSGTELILQRENLDPGIYFFEIFDRQNKPVQGKLVVNGD